VETAWLAEWVLALGHGWAVSSTGITFLFKYCPHQCHLSLEHHLTMFVLSRGPWSFATRCNWKIGSGGAHEASLPQEGAPPCSEGHFAFSTLVRKILVLHTPSILKAKYLLTASCFHHR
jgi:hypothetical protein